MNCNFRSIIQKITKRMQQVQKDVEEMHLTKKKKIIHN